MDEINIDEILASSIRTSCIVCEKTIALGVCESPLVPRLCDECRKAVLWAREKMADT